MTCITLKNDAARIRDGKITTGQECCETCPECEPGPKRLTLSIFALGACFQPDPDDIVATVNADADVAEAWLKSNGYTHVTRDCFFDPGGANGPDCDWYCVLVARCQDWGPAPCPFYGFLDVCPDALWYPSTFEGTAIMERLEAGVWVDETLDLPGSRGVYAATGGTIVPCGYIGVNPLP